MENISFTVEEKFAMCAAFVQKYSHSTCKTDHQIHIIKKIHLFLYDKLHCYVESYVQRRIQNYDLEPYTFDDYLDSAWDEIYANFPKYNGAFKLTTFFKCYIDAGIRKQYDLTHGGIYYRNHRSLYSQTALSICNTLPLDESYMQNLPSAEEQFYDISSDDISCYTAGLKDSEIYLLKLYSGIIVGYYGKKYDKSMICTDPKLIEMTVNENGPILFGKYKRHIFDAILDRYVIKNDETLYIEPNYIRRRLYHIRIVISRTLSQNQASY